MNKLQIAEHIHRLLNIYGQTLDEDTALEICGIYDEWEPNKDYAADSYIAYGTNSVGDNQLYKVIQAHTSQADWTPDAASSLYKAIGINNNGYPIWSQPTGAHDAYNTGDIVDYNGALYISLIDSNVYSPETYPSGWDIYNN